MTGKMEKVERENRQFLRKFYAKDSREIRWWQEEVIVCLYADKKYSWLREKALITKREGRIAGHLLSTKYNQIFKKKTNY